MAKGSLFRIRPGSMTGLLRLALLLCLSTCQGACTGSIDLQDEFPGPDHGGVELRVEPDAGSDDGGWPGDEADEWSQDEGNAGVDEAEAIQPDTYQPVCRSLRVVVISDINAAYCTTYYNQNVYDAVTAIKDNYKPDLVLITGDVVAGEGTCTNQSEMWANFESVVWQPLTSAGIPVVQTPGNHDASPGYNADKTAFESFWNNHRPNVTMVNDDDYPYGFSFTHKGAFFMCFDAVWPNPFLQHQIDYVSGQLQNASGYPIRITYGHVPLNPVTSRHPTEYIKDSNLEQILKSNSVSLYLSGHLHGYFPGRENDIRQVTMPSACGDNGTYLNSSITSKTSLVIIEIENDRIKSIEAYAQPNGFTSNYSRSALPEQINYDGHVLRRDDL